MLTESNYIVRSGLFVNGAWHDRSFLDPKINESSACLIQQIE